MKKLIYALPLVLALGACSNEESVTAPVETEDSGIYLTLTASLPGTRSTTGVDGASSDLTLEGTAAENELKKVSVFFFKEGTSATDLSNALTGSVDFEGSTQIVVGDGNVTLKKSISTDDLGKLVGEKLHIYVVGNPATIASLSLTDPSAASFTAANVGVNPFLAFNNGNTVGQTMPFVNHADYTVDLKAIDNIYAVLKEVSGEQIFDISNGSGDYTTGGGVLSLERALARIDFVPNAAGDKYDLTNDLDNHKLELTKLQLVNLYNGSTYLFRHTLEGTTASAYGSSGKSITLFGAEGAISGGYNWVAGPEWNTGTSASNSSLTNKITKSSSGKTFEIVGTNDGIALSDLKVDGRKYDSSAAIYSLGYVLENTIPTTELMNNTNRWEHATGIAFTFKVCDNSGNALTQNGNLRIRMQSGSYQDIEWNEDGYYLTYFGFIQHNGTSGAPMEYAIVRNNVYQLSIGTISTLPDPTQISTMYLQLNVKVLPWVLRKNEFSWTE